MTTYIIRRVLGSIPLVIVVLVVVFFVVHLVPGDPISSLLPEDATQADIARARAFYGLDKPLYVQFVTFVGQVLHFNLGTSIRYGDPVSELIAQRLPATLELAIVAAVIALVIGLSLGGLAAIKHGRWLDRVASVFGLVGISAPNFWIGLVLILYVGGATGLFPTGGRLPQGWSPGGPTGMNLIDTLYVGDFEAFGAALDYIALPAITLGAQMAGLLVRMTRSSMLEVLGEDYVRTARAKGVRESLVTVRHGMRNALLPVVTVFGLELASLLSGSIIVETVFAWPGMGQLLITAVTARDYPVVQGAVLVYALIFVLVNLLVDISYSRIDPRIRY